MERHRRLATAQFIRESIGEDNDADPGVPLQETRQLTMLPNVSVERGFALADSSWLMCLELLGRLCGGQVAYSDLDGRL